ncbi:MAG: ankyrin repeat domain-containing protein [Candidatus Electrothrix gigas]
MNEKEGEILLPNTGLKLRQKRRDKGKRHNLDDNTDFSNRSNLKRRDSCVQNFSLRYFHIEKKLRSESLATGNVFFSKTKGYFRRSFKRTALMLAVEKGNLQITELLIKNGAKAAFPGKKDTVFTLAIENGHKDIVKLLIDIVSDNGKLIDTALIAAVKKGDIDIVRILLNNKADANIINDRGETALAIASSSGRLEIVKNLIEFGANINAKGHRGETSGMLLSALNNKHPEVVCYLLEHGANVDEDDNSMLMSAIYKGYHEVVKLLLEKNIDVNSADRYGTTPLMTDLVKKRPISVYR